MCLKQIFRGVQSLLNQWLAALIELSDRQRDLRPAFPHRSQVDRDMPRVRVQAFLLGTALLVKVKHLRLRQAVALASADPRRIESQISEDFVKIVSSERADTFRSDYALFALIQLDQRGVKGSPSQVVHKDMALGFFLSRAPVTVAKLDARSRRFIQESQDVETGLPKGLRRQESLVAVGIRRNSEHHLEMACFNAGQVGMVQQVGPQGRTQLAKQLEHRDGLGGDLNQRFRAGPFKRPLERPDHRPARFFLRRPSLPSIDESLVFDGNQRRKPLAGGSVRSIE